jgi:hypothetical protein
MPFNDACKNQMLDALDEGATPTGILYVGIHTLTDPGTGTNALTGEATGGTPTYARQPVTWGSPASGQKANSGALTFDVPAGSYGFFTLWNAGGTANTGNYRGYIPFGGSTAVKGFGSVDTSSSLANDQFFSVSHGLTDGDRVLVYNVFNETLPTGSGLAEGSVLNVVGSSADTFKLSTTPSGTPIDITAKGGGEIFWQKIVPETFGAQGQITVAAGALVLDLTAF